LLRYHNGLYPATELGSTVAKRTTTQTGGHMAAQALLPRAPQQQRRTPRGWNHAESCYTLAESGASFGRSLKRQALRTVKIVTDDAEIAIGYLIRDDEELQIRVGHCTGFVRDGFQIDRRQMWRLDAICRKRIVRMETLS
jgi:hypothetical protein